MRKTKIIVTIGPSTDSPEVIDQLVESGMDCARLNFSHGTFESHAKIIKSVREASQKHNRPVAVLQDLGGIKMRLGTIQGQVQLNHGDKVSVIPGDVSDDPMVIPFPQPEILKNLTKDNRNLIVKSFFYDAYTMNQQACNSPHVIFWIGRSYKKEIA